MAVLKHNYMDISTSYSFKDLVDLKENFSGIGYCDDLVNRLFYKIHSINIEDRSVNVDEYEYLLVEECPVNYDLAEFIKEQVYDDLD